MFAITWTQVYAWPLLPFLQVGRLHSHMRSVLGSSLEARRQQQEHQEFIRRETDNVLDETYRSAKVFAGVAAGGGLIAGGMIYAWQQRAL
jgi:hypothetical protein